MNYLIEDIFDLHKKNNLIIFEHGEQLHGKKAQSIYHAHTHIILTNKSYIEQMEEELNKIKTPFKIVDFPDFSTQSVLQKNALDNSYLIFRENNTGIFILEAENSPLFSQFFRILMNKIDNQRPFINWKNYNSKDADAIKTRLTSIMKRISVETVTGILVVDKNKDILLLKSKKEFNSWVIPGGHIEYGESIEDCAKRKLKEETGLNLSNIVFFNTQEFFTKRLSLPDNKVNNRHFIFLNCLVNINSVKPKVEVDEDKTDYVWINPNKALKTLKINESIQQLIRKYIQTVN